MSNAVVFPSGNATSATIAGRRFVTPVVRRNFPIPQVADEAEKPRPLEVTLQRPAYIATDTLPTINPETQFLFWIYPGNVEGVQVHDVFETFIGDLSSGGASLIIYAEISMGQSAEIAVAGVDVVLSLSPLGSSSPWSAELTRPSITRFELGRIVSSNGVQTVVADTGNITVADTLVTVDGSGGYVRKVMALRV